MHIHSVSLNSAHGFSKQPQSSITLITGEGVAGDAHCGATTQHIYLKRKSPAQPNLTQVHLLSTELLAELATRGFAVRPGELGENILTIGLDLHALPTHTLLHMGDDVILEITGERTPCFQIEKYKLGLQAELWGQRDATTKRPRRAGIMAIVRAGGILRPEMAIRVTLPEEPHIPLGPV